MRRSLAVLLLVGTVAGCAGASRPDPAARLAARACQSNGATAAGLAAQAAARDARFATLAADTKAAASVQAQQDAELADAGGSDDSSTASLVTQQGLGTTVGERVLADCVDLGLQVIKR